ncbi:hypothetical protein HPP92_013637 [Vanilla planifolia]|uniref:Uncharacterized protein n=1 Tax=Vanilla planifolia TaxID=51239 RepID=A0A835QVY4_VANPL|nr:hypothetical protein HPP92_014074 [Vanilla planifolia]KAG0478918.1 hypothetical protein HPP92_013637 [Vanilla planifolia]
MDLPLTKRRPSGRQIEKRASSGALICISLQSHRRAIIILLGRSRLSQCEPPAASKPRTLQTFEKAATPGQISG